MRILMIRHGDPDYEHDSLTPQGIREAKALAEQAPEMDMGHIYVSPLGRAKQTAYYTLKKLGKKAEVKDWLQEFPAKVNIQENEFVREIYDDHRMHNTRIAWDLLPSYYTTHPEYFDRADWRNSLIAENSDIIERYDQVIAEFDKFLEEWGYKRVDNHYQVIRENKETITLFCHFGISCVLLSHIFNCSPFLFWQSSCMLPTSVTEVVSEERQKGLAQFRMLRLGDTTHLTIAGLKPSFSARFCEIYSDSSERH